ncbi:MAG: penicillin-binding protein activator [Gammaproteobacteria bacterium]|nr:penicillin-binding protein activator [Gammaproteobacteria bacterium]
MPKHQFAPSLKIWIQLLLLILFISGCSTSPKSTPQQAKQIVISGDYAEIARQYNKLAADAPPAQKQAYKLMMANALLKGQHTNKAKRVLQSINDGLLPEAQKLQRRLLLAKIAHQEKKPKSVLSYLDTSIRNNTPLEQITEYYDLRAKAHYKLGNKLAAVHEQIRLDPLLKNTEEIEKNQQFILRTLQSLSANTLHDKRIPSAPHNTFSGWLELAQITGQRQQREQQLNEWQRRYSNHPATNTILNLIKEPVTPTIEQPTQIALILPLSGAYSGHATSLRDGFLSAHDAQQQHNEIPTHIRIYDTHNNPDAYNTAVTDGAEFIVGPLSKKAVNTLINQASEILPVPTLTLNYSEITDELPNNLYQFGLSPEDEARQIADRAWVDGHTRAIAFSPQSDWGRRTFNAFDQRWQELGGFIAEQATYASKDNDFSGPLRSILNLNESAQRKKKINNLLQRTIKFEPRRRQDVDFIFLAASPRQARLIRPQLKFHYAADLPIYATSRVYEGTPNPAADRDMNDIIFCDTPWTLNTVTLPPEEYNSTTALQPQQTSKKGRLYALGIDAFRIIATLNRLQTTPHEQYQGETGMLSMDENNQIHRKLICARFIKGVPEIIEATTVPHENQQ